ncbi:MAG: acyl-CoA dehydrogenase family protein [Chloroflexi bacterium]|nr:acyl-CoA dehydrogenase family protein [Chloroflexota bacterium]
MAEMTVEMEVLKMLNYQVAWMISQGKEPNVESAVIKAFGTEHFNRTMGGCLQIMGLYGELQVGSRWAPANGWIQRLSQMNLLQTFGGGTNEVLRDMVATLGLGLMKSR